MRVIENTPIDGANTANLKEDKYRYVPKAKSTPIDGANTVVMMFRTACCGIFQQTNTGPQPTDNFGGQNDVTSCCT